MTDRELADLAEQALTRTTITYQKWHDNVLAGRYPDPSVTQWGIAFNALMQIARQPPPPPPPPLFGAAIPNPPSPPV